MAEGRVLEDRRDVDGFFENPRDGTGQTILKQGNQSLGGK